jgi:hypothetical protein
MVDVFQVVFPLYGPLCNGLVNQKDLRGHQVDNQST